MPRRKRLSSLALVDADDRIIADVLCIRCGRNLRERLIRERCPYCGHPASDSVHGDYLIHADRNTVRALADAARLVECGIGVLGGLMLVAILASTIRAGGLEEAVTAAYDIVFAGAVISPVIAILGVVLLTMRHSAAYYWVRYGNPRTLLRFGLLLALAVGLIATAAHFVGHVALQIGIVLWFLVPLGMFFRGIERLMRRVPNNQLAAFARAALAGLVAFAVLSILITLIRHWSAKDPSWADSQLAFTAINCLSGLALGVAAHQLIVRVRRTLYSIAR